MALNRTGAFFLLSLGLLAFTGCICSPENKQVKLLHVSFDPTRELFESYNRLFAEHWSHDTGEQVSVSQSHGGSGKQARAVIVGLHADIVSLALAFDIQQISSLSGAVAKDWQSRLPQGSSPFYSTIVFLVRKGNPFQIRDWDDLIEKELEIITPNPKTSGGARWNYLAAWGYGMKLFHGDKKKVEEFIGQMLKQVPIFDSGARAAVTTFVEREIGDVLLTWESDALLVLSSRRGAEYQVVYPSLSIRAEPVVSVVDRTVDKRGTRPVAEAYLQGLYREDAQRLVVQHHFRSISDAIMKNSAFPPIELQTVEQLGGWQEFQQQHFAAGGLFDQLVEAR